MKSLHLSLIVLALVSLVRVARAEDASAVTPSAAPSAAPSSDAVPSYKRWVVTTELLGIAGGRYGAQLEYVLSPSDSVAIYGFYRVTETQGSQYLFEGDPSYTYDMRMRAGGVDAQYRRYFTGNGASGAFIAPGLEAQSYLAITTQQCASSYAYNNPSAPNCVLSQGPQRETFTYLGASLDIGAQWVHDSGFTLGGSLGIHYRAVVLGSLADIARPWGWDLEDGPGLRPRLRFWLGWGF